ncbi:MAG: GTP 3',8-cyclase MoaA [Fretibacterium sp.]|nr:GTP 3',8-cyclase MoaA [Fretibacterium sp.]
MRDAFGREINYMRVSVTDRCNLRCCYCMPAGAEPASGEAMTGEEILRTAAAAAELGVTKLRFTGGEPLMRPDIVSLCRRAAAVPGIQEVCLTTNGTLLAAMATPLKEAGVRRVNVSLDTLAPEKFARITGGGSLSRVLDGIEAARSAGLRVKINTVLLGDFNAGDLPRLADLTRENDMDVRFIERMPMPRTEEALRPDACMTFREALALIPGLTPLPREGTAQMFRFAGARGRVGFISPMTCPFCGWCNRIRLTADGHIKPCLHTAPEIPIRGLDRAGMREALRRAILAKPEKRPCLSMEKFSEAARSMNRIGG